MARVVQCSRRLLRRSSPFVNASRLQSPPREQKWLVVVDNPLIWLAVALLSVPAVLAIASGLGAALAVAPFCCAGAAFWLYCARREID